MLLRVVGKVKDALRLGEFSCLDAAEYIEPTSARVRAGRKGIEGSRTCLPNRWQSPLGNGTFVSQQLSLQSQREGGKSVAEGYEKAIVSLYVWSTKHVRH